MDLNTLSAVQSITILILLGVRIVLTLTGRNSGHWASVAELFLARFWNRVGHCFQGFLVDRNRSAHTHACVYVYVSLFLYFRPGKDQGPCGCTLVSHSESHLHLLPSHQGPRLWSTQNWRIRWRIRTGMSTRFPSEQPHDAAAPTRGSWTRFRLVSRALHSPPFVLLCPCGQIPSVLSRVLHGPPFNPRGVLVLQAASGQSTRRPSSCLCLSGPWPAVLCALVGSQGELTGTMFSEFPCDGHRSPLFTHRGQCFECVAHERNVWSGTVFCSTGH